MEDREILVILNEIVAPYNLDVEVELFPGLRAVGVKGDGRVYGGIVNLKFHGPRPDYDILAEVSNAITGDSRIEITHVTFQVAVRDSETGSAKDVFSSPNP